MKKTNESRKIAEKRQKLEAAENSIFRTVLEKSLYGSAITDEEGNILYLNRYFAEIHGYKKEALIGKNLSVFHSEDQLPRVIKLNQMLIKEGGYEHEEVWHLHKDGTRFPMLMTGLTIYDQDGNPEYLAASAIDISERKKAEFAVVENEQRYRLLHEHSGLRVGYYKPNGMVISYNDMAAKTMGGIPSDFSGKSIFDIFPVKQAEEYMRRMKIALKSNKTQAYDDNLMINNKSYWFRSTYARIKDDNKQIIGVQIISEDITKSKEQHSKLVESENRFRNLFENHNAVMLLIDPDDGSIKNANKAAEEFYGYTKEEFSKFSIFNLNQLSKPEVIKKMKQAHKFQANKFQFKHVTKNGTVKDVEVHSTPNLINGKTYLFSIITDITEQNKSEQIRNVLYEISKVSQMDLSFHDFLEMMHRQVASIMPARNLFVALYQKDNDKYTFPYFEDETENWESNDAIDIKGSLTDYVRRKGKGQIINHINKKELTEKNEIKLVGNESSVWLGAPLINADNNEVLGVLAIQDYHNRDAYNQNDLETLEIIANNVGTFIERIQKNRALEQARAKAEESDRLKSAFLANMSHEIRTPMSGIMGFAELLKEPDLTGNEQKQYLDVILKSGERMLNTVNDIIDISKIEAGQVELKISDANIREQVEFLQSFFKPEMAKKGLEFVCSTPNDRSHDVISTDHDKLYAILTNLLKNAIKYTDSGSIEFGYRIQDNKVRFEVKDTGIGVPDDRKQAIFDRFVQADIEDTKALEGSGLGLAISSAFTEMMGGKIWVETNEPNGSTFILELPFKIENFDSSTDQALPAKANEESSKSHKDRVILIAEDEEISDMYMTEILKNECKEILHVISGREAVEMVRSNPEISIVLMDIKMPEMSGYDATREIRKFNREVIIIAQTAYALAGDREKAIEAGCNEYLAKPVAKATLMDTIKNSSTGIRS